MTLCSLSLVRLTNQKLLRIEIIYQRGDRKLKAYSYCGLTGRSEDLTRFLSSVLAVVVYPEQHFYQLNVV
jgi:hypothetical protein